jgi:hypothetical protein
MAELVKCSSGAPIAAVANFQADILLKLLRRWALVTGGRR